MNKRFCSAVALMTAAALPLAGADGKEESGVRTIRLKQSDAQVRYDSKVYELKNVTAESVLPFVNSAVQRYSRNSTVRRITSADGKREALLVSTGKVCANMSRTIPQGIRWPTRWEWRRPSAWTWRSPA